MENLKLLYKGLLNHEINITLIECMETNDITKISTMLSTWCDLENSHIKRITDMLSENELQQIATDYDASMAQKGNVGFNVFQLVSDLYYRENFHSDVICEFLNPNGSHGQGDRYLMAFLDMLIDDHTALLKNDFKDANVDKEVHTNENRRIDILIKDDRSKKAIIIENKINNAEDMYRQLPHYYQHMRSQGYDVVGIVYIPLSDNNKEPDHTDWEQEEIETIKSVIHIIPAYAGKEKTNLYTHWLLPSILCTDDIDCASTLRQYAKLIRYLNINTMDQSILEKFYQFLKKDDNMKTVMSVQNMMNNLPEYLVTRIANHYSNEDVSPFERAFKWHNNTDGWNFSFDNLQFKGNSYALGISFDQSYIISFGNGKDSNIKKTFSSLKILREFNDDNWSSKAFDIFEEDKVFQTIDEFLKELRAMKTQEE
jgi:hypothetical protein